MQRTLVFEVLTYWHAGSGQRAGAVADATVVRDPAGLPYLPGRTVKGLVRESVALGVAVGLVSQVQAEAWFGSRLPLAGATDGDAREQRLEETRFEMEPGALRFGNAELPEAWRAWARSGGRAVGEVTVAEVIDELFTHVAATAINADGVARKRTLRVREVAVPMTLRARVDGPEDGAWVAGVAACLPFLRALGGRRHRGYGRVQVGWAEEA